MTRKTFTHADKDEMRRLARLGWSGKQVAEAFCTIQSTVHPHIKGINGRRNWAPRIQAKPVSDPARDRRMIRAWVEVDSFDLPEVAARFEFAGVSGLRAAVRQAEARQRQRADASPIQHAQSRPSA